VLDPMCGSGTFVIEAAEVAAGLAPGRSRSFAFEHLASFDPDAWEGMRQSIPVQDVDQRFLGSDRDAGAIRMALANAERAGVAGLTAFDCRSVSDLLRPEGPPGLVIVNPPYGTRIGNPKLLLSVHGALGRALKERFSGWRVALVTSEPKFAHATGLPLQPPGPPIAHGGLRVKLYQTAPLP